MQANPAPMTSIYHAIRSISGRTAQFVRPYIPCIYLLRPISYTRNCLGAGHNLACQQTGVTSSKPDRGMNPGGPPTPASTTRVRCCQATSTTWTEHVNACGCHQSFIYATMAIVRCRSGNTDRVLSHAVRAVGMDLFRL